ncbi:MAG: hypothetical protein ACLFU9_03260 [Candidatus Bathyarchaeia archaeon]
MSRQHYRLGDVVQRTVGDLKLWKSERGLLELGGGALAVPVMLEGQQRGFVFRGRGRLLLDAVVETGKGAMGKPVEMEVSRVFLMLGSVEEVEQQLVEVSSEDLAKVGYKKPQDFVAEAGGLFDKFFHSRKQGCTDFGGDSGFIFGFLNQADGLDLLVAKGSKLVYKAEDLVFTVDGDKVVLKGPCGTVLSHGRKSVVVRG